MLFLALTQDFVTALIGALEGAADVPFLLVLACLLERALHSMHKPQVGIGLGSAWGRHLMRNNNTWCMVDGFGTGFVCRAPCIIVMHHGFGTGFDSCNEGFGLCTNRGVRSYT